MILVQASWQEAQTFRMIPISESCPYVECIFDPATKVFVVILKTTKTTLHMLPQLDEYGNFIPGSTLKDIGIKDQQRALNILKRCFTTESSPILPETKFEDYRPKEGFDPENIGDLKMILMIFHKIIINMIALDIDTNHIFNIYGIICLYHGYYKQPPCNNDDSCCSSGGGV